MSVTSHLKDLLTKMGGTPKDGDSTSVLIDKIEDVYDSSGSGGGSGGVSSYNDLTDRPFDVTKGYTTLFEETVTAEENPDGICDAKLTYAEIVNNDSIKVTVDGVEYSCEKYTADATVAPEGSAFYGAGFSVSDSGMSVDFSEYPFCMGSVPTDTPQNTLLLQNPGTHTIKVETSSENITTTNDFEKAVNSVQNDSNSCFIITRYVDEAKDAEIAEMTTATFKLDKTVDEIRSACEKGIPIYMRDDTTSVKIIDYRSGAYDYPTFIPKTNTSALLSSSGCTSTTTRNVRLCTNEFAASWLQESVDDFCYAGRPILVSTVAAETVPKSGKLAGLKITTLKETLDFNCNAGSDYPWYEQGFGYDVEG